MATVEFAELGQSWDRRERAFRLPALGGGASLRARPPAAARARRSTPSPTGYRPERELVVAWTCGALACASVGRQPRQILQLVLDRLPLVLMLSVYDFTRGAADWWGSASTSIPMIDFDRFVFFGQTPTEWLQSHLYEPGVVHWYDVGFTLVYTSYFIVPFATAGVLWARDRLVPALHEALVTLAMAGLAPTSPSRRRRPGWPASGACSTRSTARPRPAGGSSTSTPPRSSPAGQASRQPGRRRPLAARRASPRWSRCSSGAGSAGAGGRCCRLPAGDGRDADGDRRALLLRRRRSAGATPAA